MDQEEIIAFVAASGPVRVDRASEESGAPPVAWGDTFFTYDPGGQGGERGFGPFATIVTKDYPGFDTASDLDRPGVFRVNMAVGRVVFTERMGRSPAEYSVEGGDVDHAEIDRLLPHPVYAAQGWVSVVSPGPRTAEATRELLRLALDRAVSRHRG